MQGAIPPGNTSSSQGLSQGQSLMPEAVKKRSAKRTRQFFIFTYVYMRSLGRGLYSLNLTLCSISSCHVGNKNHFICSPVCKSLLKHINKHRTIYICVFVCVCVILCKYIFLCIYLCVCTHKYICIHCMSMCIYIYIYIHI